MSLQPPPSQRPSLSGASTAAASSVQGSSIHDESSRRRRASEFHLPSGKKILVALPEEAARLRQKFHHLSKHNDSNNTDNTKARSDSDNDGPTPVVVDNANNRDNYIQMVEVVVHGSPEHSDYLHQVRSHHESRREHFKREFGDHFEAWESSRGALEEAKRQLEGLQDHEAPNALNANFDRFGYSATLKTYNVTPGGSTPGSGAVSIAESDSENGTLRNWDERSGGRTIRLFQRPVIKQYFHRGLLWRNSEQTEVMSFELFFELIYVGIIHYNGEHVANKTDPLELGRFIVTFIMSWQIWSDVQQGVSWFEANDVLQRVYILFVIACLLGFTTNMTGTFNAEYDTYTQLTGFYIAARLATALFYGSAMVLLPLIKGFMLMQVVTILLPTALWIGSIFVDLPNRFILIALALVLDLFGPTALIWPFAWKPRGDTSFSRRLAKFYEFFPAMNIEHRVERTNAFVALVIGWAVVALLYQNAAFGFNAILGKAIIGLVQAFIFNWIYFEVDGENLHQHAIRRGAISSSLWSMAHLPFICAYTLSSAAMSKIVIASDSPNSDPLSLEHDYSEKSTAYVNQGMRWAYCAGLGIALFSMSVIGMSHVHKVPPGMRVPKKWRMTNRFAVCVVFFCLPLAKEGLNSLELVSITMGLMVWVLLNEIWGKSCPEQTWCGRGGTGGKCPKLKYEARCSKKALERALKDSAEVEVAEVHGTEKSSV